MMLLMLFLLPLPYGAANIGAQFLLRSQRHSNVKNLAALNVVAAGHPRFHLIVP